MAGRLRMWLALGVVWCGVVGGLAQTAPPASTDAALAEMAGEAGVIFAGTVLSIDRADDLGYVDVRFYVDEAVLGVRKGGTYGLREWAGLWRGAPPFHVGQRLLVMLRAKSDGGLSAPVASGVMPILGTDAPATAQAADGVSNTAGTAGPVVDLRWVGARVGRNPAVPTGFVARPQLTQATASTGPALSSVVSVLQAAVKNVRR